MIVNLLQILIFVPTVLGKDVEQSLNYTIYEQLPVGTIIGNVCRDLSLTCSDYGTIQFANTYLATNLSGNIWIEKVIDFENWDIGQTSGYIYLDKLKIDITVKVLDINDNPPLFLAHKIVLNTRVIKKGLQISFPQAIDKDSNSYIKYELFTDQPFELTTNNSNIILNSTATISTSVNPTQLRIIATDNQTISHLSYIDLVVNVSKNNEEIDNFCILNIPTALSPGKPLTTIPPPNQKDKFSYAILHNSNYSISKDGVVKRNNGTSPAHQVTVKIKNLNDSSVTYTSINIVYTTDPKPITFNLTMDVQFTVNSSTTVIAAFNVSQKADCFVNSKAVKVKPIAEKSFELILVNYSQINPLAVMNISCVPMEQNDCPNTWYQGRKIYKNTISILDQTANSKPLFRKIYEKMKVGTLVDTGFTQNFDLDDNAPFKPYDLIPNKFYLKSKKIFDYAIQENISLHVIFFSSSTNIVVKILDVNDNAPMFLNQTYESVLKRNTSMGVNIFNVTAVDDEDGDNGKINYQIVSVRNMNATDSCPKENQYSDLFRIDPKSGSVYTNSHLTNTTYYIITVRAFDFGPQHLFTDIQCFFKVMDIDVFEYYYFATKIISNKKLNPLQFAPTSKITNRAILTNIEVQDMSFTISNTEYFSIEKNTGTIKILKDLPDDIELVINASSVLFPTFKYSYKMIFHNKDKPQPTSPSSSSSTHSNSDHPNNSKFTLSTLTISLIAVVGVIVLAVGAFTAYKLRKNFTASKVSVSDNSIYESTGEVLNKL